MTPEAVDVRAEVERTREEHRRALHALRAIDNVEPQLMDQLEAASTGGDHERVVEIRDELDRLPVRRWSAELAERRAFLTRTQAELAEQDAVFRDLGPRRQELEEEQRLVQARLHEVTAEIGAVQGMRHELRYSVAQLRRRIGELERSEAGWGPVVRGNPRMARSV